MSLLALIAAIALAEPPGGIWIVAHRGAKNAAPENTIAAFEAAARMGADYIEVDVRPSLDGELVLMHDATVDRTTNGRGRVVELPWSTLRAFDAGQGQRIPLFREVLEWAKRRGVRIDIDHKAGPVDEIAREVRETGMADRVVLEGARENLLQFARLVRGADTMPKVNSVAEIPVICAGLKTTIVRLSLQQLEDPAAVKAVRDCGARVSVTILGANDTEDGMRRVIKLGAQVIETDQPALLARIRGR